MSIVYMGAFPPGYGGVTIKNQNLYAALEKEIPIKKVDFNRVKRKDIKEAGRLVFHLLNPRNHGLCCLAEETVAALSFI